MLVAKSRILFLVGWAIFLSGSGGELVAGDILRGGATTGSTGRRAADSRGSGGGGVADLARARVADRLSRTTMVVNAMRQMQSSARAGGGASVPDGLVAGGLERLSGGVWTGAGSPAQSGNQVTIKQTQQQAILNWKTFNIGKNTSLFFNQKSGGSETGKWIAFNKISDPSGQPSKILGSIKAEGQVYVINANGIVFGGSSQVNTHAFVASALPINDNLIARGLLNQEAKNARFLFSTALSGATTYRPDGSFGDVVVERGAQLAAPTTPEKVGGRITLVGANVHNAGTISTPDGQTILAAGLHVGFNAHAGSDPSLRGLDVYVGDVSYAAGGTQPPAGAATNSGLIDAPRANVTIAGKAVRQMGVIESFTSTALNGRVDLLADYGAIANPQYDPLDSSKGLIFLTKSSGTVEVGSESVTRILPEWSNAEKVVGTQLALPSQINVRGRGIHFASNSNILAPGASVTVSAGNWVAVGSETKLVYTGGQIFLEPEASIDVSGSIDISAPITQNLLTLQLRGAELANSPLQRTSPLRGPSITVDIRKTGTYNGYSWIGTPLGDISGYVGIIQRTVGELTTAGGTVNLNAGESVVLQKGSKIDVSGGWINFEGGTVQTTRILSGGVIYDLAKATPDRVYDGIYSAETTTTNVKYGITKTYSQPLALSGAHYEQGYLQGANAGAISITAPSMALDGTLLGQAVQGPRQSNPTTLAPAKAGSLNLTFRAQETQDPYLFYSPTPPKITFDANATLAPAGAFACAPDGTALPLGSDRKASVILSPDLFASGGFGTLAIDNSDGKILVPEGTDLETPLLGSITLRAANLDIAGTVAAPGGTLGFSVYNFSPYALVKLRRQVQKQTPAADPARGIFLLGSGASLSTAGLVTDHRPGAAGDMNLPPLTDGGAISISGLTAILETGSVIDVSGGFSISPTGKRSYGAGGSIAMSSGRDTDFPSLFGGKLVLGSTLKGYSGGQGGSLTVQALQIQIGGGEVERDGLLHLTPEFFTRGGFASFTLNGLGGASSGGGADQFLPAIAIAPDTFIRPVSESWLAAPGIGGGQILQRFLKPEGLRPPVSLAFGATGTKDEFSGLVTLRGDIVLGAGAVIETDAKASVTIKGDTAAILGSIIAPGGRIALSGAGSFPTTSTSGQTLPLPTVDLGPRSVLSTAGRILLTPDPYGRRIGSVLAGGTITVSGNIVAEAGAILDVSGASGFLDLAPSALSRNIQAAYSVGNRQFVPANSGINAPLYSISTVLTRVDSDAGAIILRGAEELFTDATLRGFAGGPSARGGSLVVSSGRFFDPTSNSTGTPLDANLIVTQSGLTIPAGFYPAGKTAIGTLVPVAGGNAGLGLGHFAVDSFSRGGFDSLKLSGIGGKASGAVEFSGPVSISARRSLFISDGGVIIADSAVVLEAPYVALGTAFQTPVQATQLAGLSFSSAGAPFYFLPTYGPGSLTVRASLIDIGNLSLQNIGRATFVADGGGIRGQGTLDVAGTISLRAGQIYPTTAGRFTIAAYDPNITIAASSTGSRTVTLASAILPPGFGVGSPLLGTTVAAVNGTTVTLAAYANATITSGTPVTFDPGAGSVTIAGSGARPLPLSAGGTLSIYASNILQGGTLRAPFGTINIGWDGTGASPVDYISGAGLQAGRTVAVTRQLTLSIGSVTSVSAVDPRTGLGLIIPYGFNANGTSWIDPTGIDITGGGIPVKAVNLSAVNLDAQAGSLIDIRGGGDLYASRWVTGNMGTRDIFASTSSFAILPDYEADFSPYSPWNSSTDAGNLAASDPGYVNSGLSVGDRIYLGASNGPPAGVYTLLPARYALLPGGVLVTPKAGSARETILQPEGASIVSGYRFNDLDPQQRPPSLATRFEVAPASVFRVRAQYDDFFAGSFLKESAVALGTTVPRLPKDSGRVVFSGLESLKINGDIFGKPLAGGYGAEIDISTPANILITARGGSAPAGTVILSPARLSSFGAESLLIGGTRQTTSAGTTITVKANSLEVSNAGTPLSGPEIVLVAKSRLTLDPGAEILQSGSTRGRDVGTVPLLIGDSGAAGSGNGLLLRVSDTQVPVVRSGFTSLVAQAALPVPPILTIGVGANISGSALTLDSTYGTTLDPTALVSGKELALSSGQISLAFDDPGVVAPIVGLMLSGPALHGLEAAQALSLLSYSSIDLYGNGRFSTTGTLALHSAQIRGFNNAGAGTVTFAAPGIILDNSPGGIALGTSGAATGGLVLDTGTILLGAGRVALDQFADVDFRAAGGLLARGSGGLSTQGALAITSPLITADKAVNYSIAAAGALDLAAPSGPATGSLDGGLGATLSLVGSSLTANTRIDLPSGSLSLRATTGDLVVGNLSPAQLVARGTAQTFNDLIRYTDGGRISLFADAGSVTLGTQSQVDVAAAAGGGNAGNVSISAPNGVFTLAGTLAGQGGKDAGAFSFDAGSIPGGSVTGLDAKLNAGGFTGSRSYRVRTGDILVGGPAKAHSYSLSTDAGSITIDGSGAIDASGPVGGHITLVAHGSVTLQSGARLTVAGDDFESSGKGGDVSLESGAGSHGVVGLGTVDIQTGSAIDLSVASVVGASPSATAANAAAAAQVGHFTGTLHLRAPQDTAGTDLLVDPINGTILGASSILVEGYRLFDLSNTGGVITNTGTINAGGGLMVAVNNVQGSINANGQNFLGTSGTTTPGSTAMLGRLLGADPQGLGSTFVLAPGAEIIHRTGNLVLGAANSTTTSDWNLATFRYGAKSSAGVLTLRAAGNLTFYNALSDGFTPTLASSNAAWLYRAVLPAQNPLLPANTQSWSYRLSSGADLSAADFQRVRPLPFLAANSGSLQVGKIVTINNGDAVVTGGMAAQTSTALAGLYQVIRTGSGDITVSAGRDVQLLNQFATIYTAGTRTADPTLGGNFQTPPSRSIGQQDPLGAVQQNPTYAAQYSLGGGNVLLAAQQNINHQKQAGGILVADSEKQMPTNWLYRRGYVDPATGEFGTTRDGDIGSTTWWVDFSNFFEGVGALGGGNVSLLAGNDVSNVDAVAPTNARMTYRTASGVRFAENQTLVELGGGDVTVRAGRNIDAGIYYVERGRGTLTAGDSIITNKTRTASLGSLGSGSSTDFNPSPAQWLPTTLFLGKGGFDVSAAGDVLLGPAVNPFLLPGGVNNSFWRKSYFSTFSATSGVNITSLGGSITLRESATRPGLTDDTPILQNWVESVHLLGTNPRSVSLLQPWLRLDETSVQPFSTLFTMLPGSVRSTAFSGDINLVGRLNLSPSPVGTIELAAAGAINGLQINGITTQQSSGSTRLNTWSSATINLSDADPSSIPGINSPYAYQILAGTEAAVAQETQTDFLSFIDRLFAETGSSSGNAAILQSQQDLHDSSVLHADDPEPVRLYAGTGSISGLTLFSAKAAQVVAGGSITDIAFYIQNTNASDVSVVSSGQDIVAYNANSLLRIATQASGNLLDSGEAPLAGDIQISGPGTIEVLAGRNLDLGTGANNADGTGAGLTSIGNARNPNLPFAGADIIAAAGVGPAAGLSSSPLDFESFLSQILTGADAGRYLVEIKESHSNLPDNLTASGLEQLDPELRAKVALEIFYLVLRDAGRNHNLAGKPGFGSYESGFAAISAIFGKAGTSGDINTRSRDIRTKSGGSISLLAPGGGLELASSTIGAPPAPPGIITEAGGNISIFTRDSVEIGIARIFTLRGGNEIIWSSAGDIAAGSSSKTVQSAPPTRVLIDAQSADLKVDLSGLATGGGIGVLATVGGVTPGNVDLIAPAGVVDAGDAGIQATGNLNIAAVKVLNADNIQSAGTSLGIPTAPTVAAPNIGGLTSGSSAAAAANAAAQSVASQSRPSAQPTPERPSIITVEILGYGGDGIDDGTESAETFF